MRYTFADIELDDRIGSLIRGGERLHVRPKVLALLAHLVSHRVRVVYRQELLDLLWPDVSVGESSLSTLLNEARSAVGDSGSLQRIIKTFPGRGYRFVAPVALHAVHRERIARAGNDRALCLQPLDEILVGRSDVLTRADAAICTSAGSSPRHLVLSGEMGIGRSRAAREIAAIGRGRGMRVHFAHCEKSPDAPRLWPWSQLLKSIVETGSGQDWASLLGRDAREISGLATRGEQGGDGAWLQPGLETHQARFHLFDCVCRFLRRISSLEPLLLVIEDLHWADQASLLLLRQLARSSLNGRLMVLATLRDHPRPRDAERRRILMELDGDTTIRRLQLAPLSIPDVAEFLALAGLPAVSEATIRRLHEYSGGNPLFLVETILSLARSEMTGETRDLALPLPPPPPHLCARLEGLISEMPNGCHGLLCVAAALGDSLSQPLLEAVSPETDDRLPEHIEAVLAADLIRPRPDCRQRYEFTHGVVRAALRASPSAVERARLHLRIGEAMESLHPGELDRYAPELARHFAEATRFGGENKAVDYCTLAAMQASARGDHRAAVRHFRLALDTIERCPPVDPRRRRRLQLGLAREQARLEDTDELSTGSPRTPRASVQRADARGAAPGPTELAADLRADR